MSKPDRKTDSVSGKRIVAEEVLEISELLTNSNFDLDQLLKDIVVAATVKMGYKAGAIRLIDEATGDLQIKAVAGLRPKFLELAPTFESRSRFASLIEDEGVLQIFDVSRERDLSFAAAASESSIASLIAVGLYHDDRIIGSLSVYTKEPHHFDDDEIRTLRVIANYASIALQLATLHKKQMDVVVILKELELAARIQAGVLPQKMPEYPGLKFAAQNQPWEAVGGDFFDFIELPNHNLGIAIGDVSGKGITAALFMFAVRMALRSHVEHEHSVREILRRVNNAIYKDTKAEQFATLFYGVLNVPNKVLTFVNAGHPPPLLLRGKSVHKLDTGGVPIGVLPDFPFQEEAIVLQSGDVLTFYTDGYTDVANARDEFFDMDRFTACLSESRHLNPEEIKERLDLALSEFEGDEAMGDDRTLIVLKLD